jgi:hypothetical protein
MRRLAKIVAQNASVRMGQDVTLRMALVIAQPAGLVAHVRQDALLAFMVRDVNYNVKRHVSLYLVSAIQTLASVPARKAFLLQTVTRLVRLATLDISVAHVTVFMEQHVTTSMELVTVLLGTQVKTVLRRALLDPMGLGVMRNVNAMVHLVIILQAAVCAFLDTLAPTAVKVSYLTFSLAVLSYY